MIPELAKRLGVASEKAIRKAEEYERLLRLKTAASGFHVGVTQMVICLDLAVSDENQVLDKELSLKLSGLKKPAYSATKQTIKQVLCLNKDISIKDVCVQLGCPEIASDANNLFAKYCKQASCGQEQNMDHPGFKAAAVMSLSKLKKLRLDRVRLHELSGLKKSVFDKLVHSMVALNKDMKQEMVSKPKASKRTHNFAEAVEARATAMDEENRMRDAEQQVPDIDFAEWKRRMLEEANNA
ncbi:origin recognition complex subunit 6-like [Daphnia carinata]|uniref:origin recognition complex subunit 6-like n=1 Tax=Daphnia carinata TaxID=120202 RepID=UPI002868EB18|nr:origin recognition complex subunit 6-like [Daphnia carinata]